MAHVQNRCIISPKVGRLKSSLIGLIKRKHIKRNGWESVWCNGHVFLHFLCNSRQRVENTDLISVSHCLVGIAIKRTKLSIMDIKHAALGSTNSHESQWWNCLSVVNHSLLKATSVPSASEILEDSYTPFHTDQHKSRLSSSKRKIYSEHSSIVSCKMRRYRRSVHTSPLKMLRSPRIFWSQCLVFLHTVQ